MLDRAPQSQRLLGVGLRPAVVSITIALIFALPRSGFADDCETSSAVMEFAITGNAPKGASCRKYLDQLGKPATSCWWVFPYRQSSATDFAEEMWASLSQCHIGHELQPDQLVNHPDSYVLREWATDDGVFSVSVKDKAGRQQTMVFLRLAGTGG